MSKRTTPLVVKRQSDTYKARIDPEYRAVLDQFWSRPRMMTLREVAAELGCSYITLSTMARKGTSPIPFTRIGRNYLADTKDVLDYKAAA